jgi:hypothetical protein
MINPTVTEQGQAIFEVAPDVTGFRLQAGDVKLFTKEIGYVDLGSRGTERAAGRSGISKEVA